MINKRPTENIKDKKMMNMNTYIRKKINYHTLGLFIKYKKK